MNPAKVSPTIAPVDCRLCARIVEEDVDRVTTEAMLGVKAEGGMVCEGKNDVDALNGQV